MPTAPVFVGGPLVKSLLIKSVVATGLLGGLLRAVPLEPDADEARRLVLDELAKTEYLEAQPNWFDRLATAFFDWLQGLTFTGGGHTPGLPFIVIGVVIVVGLVIVFLVFGVPRLGRRSTVTGTLFGEDDDRNSAAMRAAAARAAAAGDYTTAVAEQFRAIARGLAERTVLTVSPGTTARGFAARAGRAFPPSTAALGEAADAFDAVRYLGADGTRQQYDALVTLDATLGAARPVLEPVGA